MKNNTEPIKAAPTAQSQADLDRMKSILEDALYELGYDDTLVDILIEMNVIDFNTVDYPEHVEYQLEKYYGESIAWDDNLEEAVVIESSDIFLTGELGESWRASKGKTFRERIRDVITPSIEKLGLKVILRYDLVKSTTLSEELEGVKRHLTVDYGKFHSEIPYIDILIYDPEDLRVVAVIWCAVNLKNQIDKMVYWKLKLQTDEDTSTIKFYLVTADLDGTLKITDVPQKGRAIVETEINGTYVLTKENLQESDKVKLFEHFIEDFKKVREETQ
ncbi:MAG: BsaWI family type II restriction enzyme [Candidatus Poribacteria bacterium]|nr:BsaWI family type II restriction enzyme [Candidatus Poribacteria bacterium]